jgi:predicted house-cleaning noncanonical NTP pyrophosphatase (MazG superfamily)
MMKLTKTAVEKDETPVAPTVTEKTVDPKDLQLLQANEEIISKAQSSFLEIGKALKAIRDQEQFKAAGFENFEAYCTTKWSYSKSYASRLIGAHSCHELLRKNLAPGEVLPCNEYQLRSLAVLPEDKWVTTWQQVVKQAAGKSVTGEMVEAAVKANDNPQGESTDTASETHKPASASKLVEIRKLVEEVLKEKSTATQDKLIQVLEKIQDLVAKRAKQPKKAKKAKKARKGKKGRKGKGPKAEKAD